MTSNFETGHAVNVSNLKKYNQFLATLGATYNPSAPALGLAAMNTLHADAAAKLAAVKAAEDIWKTETNQREIAFEFLAGFSTRLLGTLKSTGANQQTVDDLAALVAKMRSKKRTKKLPANPDPAAQAAAEPVVTRSTSQLSFDQKIEHFSKIALLLKGVAAYAPNEAELKTTGLEARLADLQTLNEKASAAIANLRAARMDRNTFFYAADTGLLDLVKKSKAYILGIYGKTSQQHKAAVTHKFTRVVEKRKAK